MAIFIDVFLSGLFRVLVLGEEIDSQLSFIFLHLVQSNYFLRIDVECSPTSICCYITDKRKAPTPASVIRQLERN